MRTSGFPGNLSPERSPMTSAIRFGRFLGFTALVLIVCGGLNAEQATARG